MPEKRETKSRRSKSIGGKRLKNMKHNKTPSSFGFKATFYSLGTKLTYLIAGLNHVFISGNLSVTQTQGIITYILKGDKPKQFLKKLVVDSIAKYNL
jgi:hypothetical protein